ncbi:MAG TPA: response regulator transcription factor [Opitutaceae bacterium]|nr:response regulator transcription factor [Opitutaceae bacterium]
MNKLKIVLADDHAVVREGLKRLIGAESDMEVIGEAEDGVSVIDQASREQPDIIVMDISMPKASGIEATRIIKQNSPDIKIIALTVHEDRGYLQELLEAGSSGYVLKRAAGKELIQAIRSVASGTLYVDQRLVGNLISAMINRRGSSKSSIDALSDREATVLKLIAGGYTNKEIAAKLEVSVKTVETYKSRSMDKLGLRSRVDIVRIANEQGWYRTGTT